MLKQHKTSNTNSIQNNSDYQFDSSSSSLTYGISKIDPVTQNCEIIDLFELDNESDKYIITVLLNGTQKTFEVDSGAKFSFLSKSEFNKLELNVPIQQSNLAFRSYTGNLVKPLGKVSVRIQYEGKEMTGDLHIVPDGHDALLGRQWIRGLQIELNRIDRKTVSNSTSNSTHLINSEEDIFQTFPNVIEKKIGCEPNCQVQSQLRPNDKPVFTKERKVLTPFDPHLPVVLATDASPYGIAAVLSHTINDIEHPIAYASRSLTSSEQNYSQLDREALGLVFGVTHFYNYLYGKHFTLITDNQPLTRIFHPNKSLPQMTSARLLRYASFLSGFDYTVQFKKGKENENVDCMSRAPISKQTSAEQGIGEEVNQLYEEAILQISSNKVTCQVIKEETERDNELKNIINMMKNNSDETDYTLVEGILFRNNRVVIPASLQSQILTELHATHLGITKMKQLARRYVYWPKIDRDIERLVRSCEACAQIKSNPPKVTVHPWECPQNNWERVHVDYAGPFQNAYFLVCVDAKSKWIEVQILKSAPTSSSTINLLENIFSSHGYPVVLVSDNHSIFQSDEFHTYCTDRGIFQKYIAPGHPATNGLAERNIQTLKNRLKTLSNESTPLHVKLQDILLRYRATPLACGQTPAELYLNRKMRIRLDAVFPYHPQSAIKQFKPVRSLHEGERVQVKLFIHNKYVWEFGTVTKCLGTRHYLVQLDTGRTLKRHINQLRSSLVPKKTVTFGPPQLFSVPRLPQSEVPVQPPARLPQSPVQPESPAAHAPPQRSPRPVRTRRPIERYGNPILY
uniref:RNA-directed DNA polymerase n=1 Tax=Cacopsylla melanoneura TaxID=428564 RepID=A0A8D9DQK4_9HEMI